MAIRDGDQFGLNLAHPKIMRAILAQVQATGDVLGRDEEGRTVLAVAVDNWRFDAMAGFDTDIRGYRVRAERWA